MALRTKGSRVDSFSLLGNTINTKVLKIKLQKKKKKIILNVQNFMHRAQLSDGLPTVCLQWEITIIMHTHTHRHTLFRTIS